MFKDMEVSELQVQQDSGVLDTILEQPGSDGYIDKDDKEDEKYRFWWRTTIGYDFACMPIYNMDEVLESMRFFINLDTDQEVQDFFAALILAGAPLYVLLVIWAGNDGKDVYCYMFNCGTLTMLLLTVPLTYVLFV